MSTGLVPGHCPFGFPGGTLISRPFLDFVCEETEAKIQ
jgi:hypothetical protein